MSWRMRDFLLVVCTQQLDVMSWRMRDFLLVVCIVAACLSQLMWCMSDKSDAVCQRIIKVELHYDMLSKLRWSPLTVESLNAAESSAKQNVR